VIREHTEAKGLSLRDRSESFCHQEGLLNPLLVQRFSTQRRHAAFRLGTLAPFSLASDKPMAMACFLLVTLPPLPALPERKVPFFRLRIAL
jgi:hypothetical protein